METQGGIETHGRYGDSREVWRLKGGMGTQARNGDSREAWRLRGGIDSLERIE